MLSQGRGTPPNASAAALWLAGGGLCPPVSRVPRVMRMESCVLVMVEESAFRQALVSALESASGLQVLLALSVDEMLARSAQRTPDLLLLDLQVGGMSDLEPLAILAERSELIMTRFWVLVDPGLDEDTRSTLACYADRLIFMPVEPSQLAEQILAETSPPGSGLRWVSD